MQASKIASCEFIPRVRSASRATSIIMMAFFFTIPISRMTPMNAMIEKSVLNNSNASNAPTPAEGNVDRMVSGCT